MDVYKKHLKEAIDANTQLIVDIKKGIKNGTGKIKSIYKKEAEELEKKNEELKKKVDDYKEEGARKWEQFKSQVEKEMDTLEKGIKNLINGNS